MNEHIIDQLCYDCLSEHPISIERCSIGQGNYVYQADYANTKYIVRCSQESNAYTDTTYWLERLHKAGIPVPKILARGRIQEYEYLILTYIYGYDLGIVYRDLTKEEKKKIAKIVIKIQRRVGTLELEHVDQDWSWTKEVITMFDRARERIDQNGYFDIEKVERLENLMPHLNKYFQQVKPIAYLDDITTKNLLIDHGQFSGIIDVDWIGIGDPLTFIALTNMALLNMDCDTDYITFLLEEQHINKTEEKAFLFYTLMYCVDFMGERGMQFMDKRVEVNREIIDRLNHIYEQLWDKWQNTYES